MTPKGRLPYGTLYEMHISDIATTNPILTKCTKMTEEGRKRHGMNGNTDGGAPVIKEEAPRNTYGQGGRLKFFKGNCIGWVITLMYVYLMMDFF